MSWEPRIVGFLCNWCAYAGADLAGTSRLPYPPNLRTIRVMCSGKVNPLWVLRCFQQGADGVFIGGCHPGECHYREGNYYNRRRLKLLRNLLEYVGINPKRLQAAWVSASEGQKFAKVVEDMVEEIRALGPMKKIKRRIEW